MKDRNGEERFIGWGTFVLLLASTIVAITLWVNNTFAKAEVISTLQTKESAKSRSDLGDERYQRILEEFKEVKDLIRHKRN